MKKWIIIIYALLVVGVAALMPAPAQACNYKLCFLINCQFQPFAWSLTNGGDCDFAFGSGRIRCTVDTGAYVSCAEYACCSASAEGTAYSVIDHQILAAKFIGLKQGKHIMSLIARHRNESVESVQQLVSKKYGIRPEVITEEAFNSREKLNESCSSEGH